MAHEGDLGRENSTIHTTCRGDGNAARCRRIRESGCGWCVCNFVHMRSESFLFAPWLGRGVVCDGELRGFVDGGCVLLWLGMEGEMEVLVWLGSEG
jgi:hypothetical protein